MYDQKQNICNLKILIGYKVKNNNFILVKLGTQHLN